MDGSPNLIIGYQFNGESCETQTPTLMRCSPGESLGPPCDCVILESIAIMFKTSPFL